MGLSTVDAHAPIIHRGIRRHRLRIGHLLHYLKVWSCLYLHLLCDLQGVVHLNARVPDGTLQLGVSQQKLNRSEILGALVDQRRLGTAQGVGTVLGRIQIDGSHPPIDDPRILSGRQVRRVVLPAGEEVIVLSQTCLCDPGRDRRSAGFGDFELNGALCLALQDYRSV